MLIRNFIICVLAVLINGCQKETEFKAKITHKLNSSINYSPFNYNDSIVFETELNIPVDSIIKASKIKNGKLTELYINQIAAQFTTVSFSNPQLYIDVYSLLDGNWQIIAHNLAIINYNQSGLKSSLFIGNNVLSSIKNNKLPIKVVIKSNSNVGFAGSFWLFPTLILKISQ